jgi:aryl-alcohol dehydrogenase-like predicted oxidoreductase
MTFGRQCDEAASFQILNEAEAAGINFIDTADVYPVPVSTDTSGRTEEIIGRWFAGRDSAGGKRDRFVLATKCRMQMGPGANDSGLSRRHVLAAIEASLKRLQTDYVDLYQVHSPDPETPIEETLRALDTIVQSGKARYIGCSNFQAWQLALALNTSARLNGARFESVQPRYNLLYREIENELVPLCLDQLVGIMVYNPLAGGMLTGKHDRNSPPASNTRFAVAGPMYRGRYWNDHVFDAVDRLKSFFAERNKPLTHAAISWTLGRPGITSAIIGATSADQLRDSLAGVSLQLDDDELEECDRVWYELPRVRNPKIALR